MHISCNQHSSSREISTYVTSLMPKQLQLFEQQMELSLRHHIFSGIDSTLLLGAYPKMLSYKCFKGAEYVAVICKIHTIKPNYYYLG